MSDLNCQAQTIDPNSNVGEQMYKLKDKVKLTKQICGHPAGREGVITNIYNDNEYVMTTDNGSNITVWNSQIEKIASTIEDITDEIKALDKEIEILKGKIRWMSLANKTVYNEIEHKIYKALDLLDTEGNKTDLVTELAELFHN